jgi:hypothetical protein
MEHRLHNLPPELREMVWLNLFPKHRILKVDTAHPDLFWINFVVSTVKSWKALHVCGETRRYAEKNLSLYLSPEGLFVDPVPINFDSDIFMFKLNDDILNNYLSRDFMVTTLVVISWFFTNSQNLSLGMMGPSLYAIFLST